VVAARRVRILLTAGLLDSFGLSLGWTAFLLIAVGRGGLPAAGLYNAAMLAGVVGSAPVTGWIASRLDGRVLLRCTGAVELVLRVGTLAGLLAGWPSPLLAAGVTAMNVAAWSGYAGMRAEVAAADPGPRSLTRYAMAIAAVEAVGAGAAALLPIGAAGQLGGAVAVGVLLVYGSSVTPQFLIARTSVVRSGRSVRSERAPVADAGSETVRPEAAGSYLGRHRRRAPVPMPVPFGRQRVALVSGALIMLVASGPVTLGTALAQQLYGHAAVGLAAMVFSAGCLLADPAAAGLARLGLPSQLRWLLWGAGMLVGWLAGSWQLTGLLGAQLLAAIAMTAFQGEMDAAVAQAADASRVTSALAWSAAVRACGSAVAVRLLPALVAAPSIGLLSAAATAVLLGGGLFVLTVAKLCAVARRAAGRSSAVEPTVIQPVLAAMVRPVLVEPAMVEPALAGASQAG
jgi:hypothetical protein